MLIWLLACVVPQTTSPKVQVSSQVPAFVAARDILPGVPIQRDDLTSIQIEPEHLPAGALTNIDEVVGTLLRRRLFTHEFLISSFLVDPLRGVGVGQIVPRGTRVVEMPRAQIDVSPGSFVDLWIRPDATHRCIAHHALFVIGRFDGRLQLSTTPSEATLLERTASNGSLHYTIHPKYDIRIDTEHACSSP